MNIIVLINCYKSKPLNNQTMKNQRLVSLDAFRGLTIAFMILVNNPGTWANIYYPLRHAEWHGCTPTDLVFPFFLFIVGVSMYMAFGKFNHELNSITLRKIGKRTFLIFLIGVLLNWFPFYHTNIGDLRIMGVLQRIALAYGVGALICLSIPIHRLFYIGIGILLFYWALLGFSVAENPFELETNFARTIDLMILGESHVWNGFGLAFDPEGLVSTIPAVVTVIAGYIVGWRIKTTENKDVLIKEMLFYGFIAMFAGWFWDKFFPINKALWTSSYVLYTAGIASIGLGMMIEIIDIQGRKRLIKPMIVFGTNPMFAYVLSGILFSTLYYLIMWKDSDGNDIHATTWLYENIFQPIFGDLNGSLLYAISFVLVCWFFTWLLYRKKIFVKI
jgi:predicted acyltransferase